MFSLMVLEFVCLFICSDRLILCTCMISHFRLTPEIIFKVKERESRSDKHCEWFRCSSSLPTIRGAQVLEYEHHSYGRDTFWGIWSVISLLSFAWTQDAIISVVATVAIEPGGTNPRINYLPFGKGNDTFHCYKSKRL